MIKKYSLHIGLNTVDESIYLGEYDKLNNAEYDAMYYENFAKSKGFITAKLLGEQATSTLFFSKIEEINKKMKKNDLFFLSFSGHGTRVKDLNLDEEEDGKDEVLVFYDRLVIDDELGNLWYSFNDTRIFFLSDSCNNGKVSKFYLDTLESIEDRREARVIRGVDMEESYKDFEKNIDFYSSIKLRHSKNIDKKYALIHIASCQNNQVTDDGTIASKTSLFTSFFRERIDNEVFNGSYRELYDTLLSSMPNFQIPEWDNHNELNSSNFENFDAFQ